MNKIKLQKKQIYLKDYSAYILLVELVLNEGKLKSAQAIENINLQRENLEKLITASSYAHDIQKGK